MGVYVVLTVAAAVLLLVAAGACLWRQADVRKDIGCSLLTGALLAGALGVVQIHLDKERDKEAATEQFRQSVGMTQHLEGLDPKGFHPDLKLSLGGAHLSGKILDRAKLEGVDLSKANLAEAKLRDANLKHADLRGASLFDADLTRAELQGADLRKADLRFADMRGVSLVPKGEIDPTTKLGNARVNHSTCWPEVFLSSRDKEYVRRRTGLKPKETVVHGVRKREKSLGHACRLTLDGISGLLAAYKRSQTQTIGEIANTLGLPPKQVATKLTGRASKRKSRIKLPIVVDGPCAGLPVLHVNLHDWARGFVFLLIQQPGREQVHTEVVQLVRRTLKGKRVERLQERLREDGHKIKVDGVYGPHTDDALEKSTGKREFDTDPAVQSFLRWRQNVDRTLRAPLGLGDRVTLVGTSAQNDDSLEFGWQRRVPRC